MKDSRINDTTSWRQWAEDIQKSKDEHSIFLSLDEIRKKERDTEYREHLAKEVVEKMKLHKYGSFCVVEFLKCILGF